VEKRQQLFDTSPDYPQKAAAVGDIHNPQTCIILANTLWKITFVLILQSDW